MRTKWVGLAGGALLLLLLLGGCGGRQAIVLVPDPDGHLGKAEVATAGGKQQLEKPGDMTRISGPAAPPSAVTTADPAYIAATFGEVLAIEPAPPEKFTLYFETGTTVLRADSRAGIATIVAACKRRAAVSIAISGHTDATASVEFNDKLARERAELVKGLLLQQGIESALMSVTSHGKGNPAVPTPDGVAEPRNRRVEVIVH